MGEYRIKGKRRLCGELTVGGAKNAVLPMLAAVVLNGGISVLHNCPKISDVYTAVEILQAIGCKTSFSGGTIIVDSSSISGGDVPENLARKMRCSVVYLGALLGRFKKVHISHPGGCENFLRRGVTGMRIIAKNCSLWYNLRIVG